MTRLEVFCPVCRQPFDWQHGYGRNCRCCSKACYAEFDWRYTLSILGKPYEPRKTLEDAR